MAVRIKVLDLSPIALTVKNPLEQDFKHLASELDMCFKDIGFAYIENHGIDKETIKTAMQSSMNFFNLDREQKNLNKKGLDYQGWVEMGREIFDQEEEGKIAELEVRETYDMKNISQKGKFPDEECPELRVGLTNLAESSSTLAERLLHCLSLSCGQKAEFLEQIHKGMLTQGQSFEVENCTTLR